MKRFLTLTILATLGLVPLAWGRSPLKSESLNMYFKPSQIQQINQYTHDLKQLKKLDQFMAVFKQATQLQKQLSPVLETLYMQFLTNQKTAFEPNGDFLEKMIPGLKTAVVAEGSTMLFFLDYRFFSQKAKQTPETDDDLFMAALTEAFGPVESIPGDWFTMTWDLGGCSNLGSGKHLKIFQKSGQALQKNPVWQTYLGPVQDSLVRDIVHHNSFCHSQPKVLSEMRLLLNSGLLKPAHKEMIQQRQKVFERHPQDIEFGCSEGHECGHGG